jgi:hypothetical protein
MKANDDNCHLNFWQDIRYTAEPVSKVASILRGEKIRAEYRNINTRIPSYLANIYRKLSCPQKYKIPV